MAFYHDHYVAGRNLPTGTALLQRLGRFILAVLLLLFLVRDNFVREEFLQTARIDVQGELLQKTTATEQLSLAGLGEQALLLTNQVLYLSPALEITHRRNFVSNERFCADQWGYVVYRKVADDIVYYDRSGTKRFVARTATYPRLAGQGSHVALFTGDQSGIGFLRTTGKESGGFQYFTTVISALAVSGPEESAYLGLLDGSLEKLHIPSGRTSWRSKPGGSRIALIKGVSLAPDRKAVAVLSGLDPEQYILYSAQGRRLWSYHTKGALRRQAWIAAGNRFCFGHTQGWVYVLDRNSGHLLYADAPSRPGWPAINHCHFAEGGDRALFSFSWAGWTTVQMIDRSGHLLFQRLFASPYVRVAMAANGAVFSLQTDRSLLLFRDPRHVPGASS